MKDNEWEYIQESGSVKIDSFSSKEEIDKMNEYAENDEWDKISDLKVLPELKPYLKYARNNPLMDILDLKKFYTKGKSTKKQGTLDGNKFNLGKKLDEDEIKRLNKMGWFHVQ